MDFAMLCVNCCNPPVLAENGRRWMHRGPEEQLSRGFRIEEL